MIIMKKYLNRVFIEGFSGMALGLFATLIIGTILCQIAKFIPGVVGDYMSYAGNIAKTLMGAGIGVGVASKYKEGPLVCVAAAVAGMIGAFPSIIGTGALIIGAPGNPLSAFVAAYAAIEAGHLISGKTPVDIILTPLVVILVGSVVGYFAGPYIAKFSNWMGEIITVNVDRYPLAGGMLVSVMMGIFLTLPISSAAIGIVFGLSGLSAGAATVGCCCQMVGFAVMSFRENKVGGLISQGLGTSMIQMPNIIKNPRVWIPPIISSIVISPLSTLAFKMHSDPVGAGMGSSGLVGQFETYATMVSEGVKPIVVIGEIALVQFVLPAIITLAISEGFRKANWIKNGDLKLDV